PILATAVRRSAWLLAHVAVTLGSAVVLMGIAGLAMGIGTGTGLGQPEIVSTALMAHLLRMPELAALMGLAVALYGLRPRWMFLGWVSLVYGVVLTYFMPGRLGAPIWVHFGSPYGLVPRMPPFDQFDPAAWFGLLGTAAALILLGNWAFTR